MRSSVVLLTLSALLRFGSGFLEASDVERVLDTDTGITLPEGFEAEVLYDVPKSQGSWVAMAFDPEGRLIVSDQDDKGVFRVTLPDVGNHDARVRVESLDGFPFEPIPWGERRVGGALGFLYAFDSLYMSTMKGFYRCRDTDGDDQYDQFTRLKKLRVGYEHSAHSIIQTEDGEGLYLVSGNYTPTPEGTDSLQPPVWEVDTLLPAMPDPMGHAVGLGPPGGWVCRISPDGEDWTMVASGFRNAVDLAINREGELFTFDSDLEFDVGSPWYRPTRINHIISGGEYGWRSGSAKWPNYYADSHGSVLDVGPGSPTGISFGHHSNFPARYQDKLFVCDWTFGTIYTVDLEEKGSSYTGTKKEFLSGSPLNISAMRFGPDGHMYFIVGGRNTESKLYRIRYVGPPDPGPGKRRTANRDLRELRHSLEAYHGRDHGPEAVAVAWPYLSHDDRSIRYAARLAIENQALEHWREKLFTESNPRAVIYGIIALCRHGEPSLAGRIFAKLGTIDFAELGRRDRLALLRAYALGLIRLEGPDAAPIGAIVSRLDPHYPAEDDAVNAELCRVLSHLNAPSVVAKTIALMKVTEAEALAYDEEMLSRHRYGKAILEAMANAPNSQNIHYAYCLRGVSDGWSRENRKVYFSWLNDSLKQRGGKSFAGYLRAIRQEAIDQLPPEEATALEPLLGKIGGVDLAELPLPEGPPVAWTTETVMELFKDGLRDRDFDNGKKMFAAGRCVACHRMQGSGGYSGPDLGSVGSRYSIRDIVVAIIEPSDSISDQYQAKEITLDDGTKRFGRMIRRGKRQIDLAMNPYDISDVTGVPTKEIETIRRSQVSMMPPGTLTLMNAGEVADLMAYLVSGGDRDHEVFPVD